MEQLNPHSDQVSERGTYWNKWRIILLGIFVVTFLATLLLFIYRPRGYTSRRAGEGAGAPAITVELTPVKMRDVSIEISKQAAVVPTSEVPIMSEQVGWVEAVAVKKGQNVKAGRVVATLRPADNATPATTEAYQTAFQNLRINQTELNGAENALSASLSTAAASRARLAQAQADLVAARNAERLAQRQYETAVQRLQDQNALLQQSQTLLAQGAVSRTELESVRRAQSQASSEREEAQQALNGAREQSQTLGRLVAQERAALTQSQARVTQAETQVRAARSRVQSQQSAVQQTETQLRNIRQNQKTIQLKSPVDGVVSEVAAKPGSLLTPAMLVARIKRPDTAIATLAVAESDAKRLKTGMSALVELPEKGRTFTGRLSAVTPIPGAQGQSRRVVIDVPRASQSLKPGNQVKARISYDMRKAAVIPGSAIVSSVKGPAVWTVKDGVAHVQQVKLAQSSGRTVVVTAGLRDGDHIITSTAKPLREGSPVAVRG